MVNPIKPVILSAAKNLLGRWWPLLAGAMAFSFLALTFSLLPPAAVLAQGPGAFKTREIASNGPLTLYAGGTNQNITLTPSGTGFTILNGNVGIGTTNPAFPLHLVNPIAVTTANVTLDGFGTPPNGSNIAMRSARGTVSLPTAVQLNDRIAAFTGFGYGATSFSTARRAGLSFFAAENWTDANQGSYLILETTPTLSTTVTERMRIDAAGNVGIGATANSNVKLDVNGAIRPALNSVAFSATPTFDVSLGNTQKITLTGNVTSSTLSNAVAGEEISFIICQDATGGRTFVWPTNVKGPMTIGGTLSTCSAQSFVFDGTNAFAVSPGVTNM